MNEKHEKIKKYGILKKGKKKGVVQPMTTDPITRKLDLTIDDIK